MIDFKRYDDVMNKAKCISTGEVYLKENGKWSYKVSLSVLPMDERFDANGPDFESAMEAATAMYRVFGADSFGWEK